jgi:hypothetical protein
MKKHMKGLLCCAAMLTLSPLSPLTGVAHASGASCPEITIIEWRSPGDIEVDFNLPETPDGGTVTVDGIVWSPVYGQLPSESRSFACTAGTWN